MTHFYAISSNILLRCALHAAFGSVFLLFKHHFFLPSSHTAFGSGFWKFVQFHFSTFTNRDKTLLKAISLNILLLCALHAAFGSVFLVWKLHFFFTALLYVQDSKTLSTAIFILQNQVFFWIQTALESDFSARVSVLSVKNGFPHGCFCSQLL